MHEAYQMNSNNSLDTSNGARYHRGVKSESGCRDMQAAEQEIMTDSEKRSYFILSGGGLRRGYTGKCEYAPALNNRGGAKICNQ
jgi:hypothetical protein